MSFRKIGLVLTLLLSALAFTAASAMAGTQVPLSGTGSPQTGDAPASGLGDATTVEFPGVTDDEGDVDAYDGIVDRSLSNGVGPGTSINSGKKAKSNPQLNTTFEGLNFYQQRYSRSGNQFSVEPPDQGMCAGNGYVLEAVNDVVNIFNASGQSALPDNTATNVVGGFPRNVNHAVDLNSFFGYPAAINRSTGVRGPELTDPTCIYDAATQRFFFVVLTLNTQPNGALTHVNHLDLAVSQTSNPTGGWNIYKIDVTNDGSNIGGVNPGPYLGDYPHIGADAYGVYLTTNAYPWLANGFAGAQIYALSKAQLAAGALNVNMQRIDTSDMVNLASDAPSGKQPGFTVWPAQSPSPGDFQLASGGTEYFLSSTAADEATHPAAGFGGNYVSNKVVVWSLKNTSSLDSSPALSLSNRVVTVNQYAIPPKQIQPGSGSLASITAPLGNCINDTTTATIAGTGCWRLLFGGQPQHNEVVSRPDSNDTRMQQVDYANGKLWGALDTAVSFDTTPANNRAGIAWYVLNPANASVVKQGTYGVSGASLTYPAIGVTSSGRGVMAFSYTDGSTNPSAAYAPIDAAVGVGDTHIIATGANPDDGFTSYKAEVGNPPRTRWGDYGAASVDGNSVWVASELTNRAPACDYTDWGGPFFAGGSGDNLLGTCGGASHGAGVRAALGNWSTQISKLTP